MWRVALKSCNRIRRGCKKSTFQARYCVFQCHTAGPAATAAAPLQPHSTYRGKPPPSLSYSMQMWVLNPRARARLRQFLPRRETT